VRLLSIEYVEFCGWMVLLKSSGLSSSSDKNDVTVLVAPIQKPLYTGDDETA
jgi:hypothetical protein